MAKGFRKNNPLDKLSGTSKNIHEQHSETTGPGTQDIVSWKEATQPTKRKAGRPKTRDVKRTCKNINVAVPITLLNQWEDIKIVHETEPLPAKAGRFDVLLKQPKAVSVHSYPLHVSFILSQSYRSCSFLADLGS